MRRFVGVSAALLRAEAVLHGSKNAPYDQGDPAGRREVLD